MTPRFGGPPDDDDLKKDDSKKPLSSETPAATQAHIVRNASSAWQERAIKPLQADPVEPANLGPFIGAGKGLKPTPIHVPPRLLDAFKVLGSEPVLSGGSAVQVWTGRFDDIFLTYDLDFITHLQIQDLAVAGLDIEKSGRHAMVDGVVIEFPFGPLAINSLYLDPKADSVMVPTLTGDQMRCLRPEACVLDRLAQVAGWQVPEAFLQASAVVVAQAGTLGWDQDWIDLNAARAGLSRQWEHLKAELDHPSKEGLERALEIGLD